MIILQNSNAQSSSKWNCEHSLLCARFNDSWRYFLLKCFNSVDFDETKVEMTVGQQNGGAYGCEECGTGDM